MADFLCQEGKVIIALSVTIGIVLHFQVKVEKIPAIAWLILQVRMQRRKKAFDQNDVSKQLLVFFFPRLANFSPFICWVITFDDKHQMYIFC